MTTYILTYNSTTARRTELPCHQQPSWQEAMLHKVKELAVQSMPAVGQWPCCLQSVLLISRLAGPSTSTACAHSNLPVFVRHKPANKLIPSGLQPMQQPTSLSAAQTQCHRPTFRTQCAGSGLHFGNAQTAPTTSQTTTVCG